MARDWSGSQWPDPTKNLLPRITKLDRRKAADKHLAYRLPQPVRAPADHDVKDRLLHAAHVYQRAKLLLATVLAQPDLDDGSRKGLEDIQRQLLAKRTYKLSGRQWRWVFNALGRSIPCSVPKCPAASYYQVGVDTYCQGHRQQYEGARDHYNKRANHGQSSFNFAQSLKERDALLVSREQLRKTKARRRK